MGRENPPQRWRGETREGKKSGCREKKRSRNSTDRVDTDSDQ